jgi:hypothetical protein
VTATRSTKDVAADKTKQPSFSGKITKVPNDKLLETIKKRPTFSIGQYDFLLGLGVLELGRIEIFDSLQNSLLGFLRCHFCTVR